MYKPKYIQLAALFTLFTIMLQAQERKIASAEKLFGKYAYVDAIKTYERVAESGHKSTELFQKLGDAYYFNGQLDQSNKWYTELFSMNEQVPAEYYYRYSQTLKAVGDYVKANEMLEEFAKINSNDLRVKLYHANENYLTDIKNNSGRYEVRPTEINSGYSDYGSSFYGNNIVFSSSKDTVGVSRRVDRWTNQAFSTLYIAELNADGFPINPKKFDKKVDSKYHESTPAFTMDGKTMYFTRNSYINGKAQKDKEGNILLKIYRASLEDGHWQNIIEMPFSSNEYSVAHPALSSDEKFLYFASNQPGTHGASDIYRVNIAPDGTYGTPENLGIGINTEGRETFPFITKNNELYFASDGHPGLGGLDVYVSNQDNDGNYRTVINIGEPVNSKSDDFSFVINTDTNKGFFSSNRGDGQGYDDIYSFTELKKIEVKCNQLLAGIITNSESQPLANAKVTVYDAQFNELHSANTDANGAYSFQLKCGLKHYIRVEKEGYTTKETDIIISENSGTSTLPLILESPIKEVTVGSDLGKTFGIGLIYFDLDDHAITDRAAVDLEKIVDVMKQYPSMKIDVRSHTDSRASHLYNDKLSNRRAKSTIEFMVKRGINIGRLTGRGYGETQLLNDCINGKDCSEQEHQLNRRSEFIIISL